MKQSFIACCFLSFTLFFIVSIVFATNSCININIAPQEELEKIKHIGQARAKQIITLRGEKPFSSVDELDRVIGIGPARVSDIKQEGLACILLAEVRPPLEAELQKIYPGGIVINEIMPSPEGSDETGEWIKIFNRNNFEADLAGWQITDTVGKTNLYAFPAGTKISAMGFLVLSRPETKIILNNDTDGLKLIQPDGKTADSVNYEKAPRGQSYSLINSSWAWSGKLTPKIEKIKNKEKGLAAASEPINLEQNNNNSYQFLAMFALAIFSGFVILLLKHVRTQPRQDN